MQLEISSMDHFDLAVAKLRQLLEGFLI